jgi:glucosamine--fructose-6-phosphate aminotransferase (isomerizing)
MCGILGTVIHTGTADLRGMLIGGLRAVEYRGYDSSGVAILNEDGMSINKRAGKIGVLEEHLGEMPLFGSAGMGHTRWATHGEPNDTNSHPHQDMQERITIIHNGIIENYGVLKDELQSDGVVFTTQTDTEVAANLIAKYYSGDLPSAVRQATSRLQGSYSLCVMANDKPHMMVGVRYRCLCWSAMARTRPTRQRRDGLRLHARGDLSRRRRCRPVATAWTSTLVTGAVQKHERSTCTQAQKGGYDTFMLKEIHEQPQVIRQMLERYLPSPGEPIYLPGMDEFFAAGETTLISLIGCGTAWHACKVGKYVFEGLAKIPCRVDYAHEAVYHAPARRTAATIAVSQSGETADTISAAKVQQQPAAA